MDMREVKRRLRPLKNLVMVEPAVRLGMFRRLKPLSRSFGFSRGKPIDRYYIEGFLDRHRHEITGRVLEAGGGAVYGHMFGDDRVTQVDVMYPRPGFANGTLVADLVTGDNIASEAYDTLLLTQVFNHIFDVQAAVDTSWRALKPGGVMLATLCGLGQISTSDAANWGDFWRFTNESAARLFGGVFGAANVSVETFGNVYVACAFMQCLASKDLTTRELDYHDPDYQLTITVRATKPTA